MVLVAVVGAVLALSRPLEDKCAVMNGYEMEVYEEKSHENNIEVENEHYKEVNMVKYEEEPKERNQGPTALPYWTEVENESLTALPYQAEGSLTALPYQTGSLTALPYQAEEGKKNLTALPYQVGEIKELYGKILHGMKKLNEKVKIELCTDTGSSMEILLTMSMLMAVLRMRENEEPEKVSNEEARVKWMLKKVATGVQLVRSVCLASSQKRNSSRLERRRCHLSMRERRKHLRVLMFVAMVSHARCMDQQVFMERIAEMTQAATRAAAAAAQASERLQTSRSSTSGGLETASRVLKSPETFNGENPLDFLSWKTSFETWLGFADEKYSDLLEKVEKLTRKPVMSTYSEDQQGVARKFFAILSSHLRGRCGSLVRAHSKEKDGFALWFDLLAEFLPSTKQRSLSLAQALSQYPNFNSKQSMMESILQFEQLVQAYETSSSQTYPKDLMTATLLRCAPNKIRDHLQLSLREDSTYADVREAMLSYERVTRGYSQTLTADHSTDAVPMEVDRVKGDGKGGKGDSDKGKGKGKGRGAGWWNNLWSFGRGRGKGRGRGSKGFGKKGKSKGKSKGKGKDKGYKGKSKGKNKGGCFNCGDPNHFSRDCPRGRSWHGGVNQVEQEQQFGEQQQPIQPQQQGQGQGQGQQQYYRQSTPGTQTTQNTYRGSTTSSSSTVRRVFHLGLIPGAGSVNMVTDLFYEWLEGEVNDDGTPTSTPTTSSNMVEVEENEEDVEWLTVRMSNQVDAVILDSGSDANVLPRVYASDNVSASKHRLRNCEGTPLKTYGTRETELVVTTLNGEEVVLKQQFVVGEVTSCLLSLGQLLETGWSLVHRGEHGKQLALQSPEKTVEVPVYYKGSSLAMDAWIRCVNENLQEVPEEEEQEDLEVRVLVAMKEDFDADVYGLWHATNDGKVYKKYRGRDYEDARMMWGEYRPYRTTLRRPMGAHSNEWELLELSQNYIEKDDSGGPIEECKDADVELLAIVTNVPVELGELADILGDQPIADAVLGPELQIDVPEPEQQVPEELWGEAIGHDEGEAIPETVNVNGMDLTERSPIKDLRKACEFLGTSQGGSKVRLYERIVVEHKTALRRRAVEVAVEEYHRGQVLPREQELPKQPSERERRLHKLTHIPYRAWCAHCVSCKAKDDSKRRTNIETVQQRSFPTVQLDVMFGVNNNAVVLLVDVWTRFCQAVPMRRKSGAAVAEAIVAFLGLLGYFEKVEIVCDNEPLLRRGVEQAKVIREKSKLETTSQFNKAFDKGRTAIAERTIQTVRNQAKTLISHLEENSQSKFADGHPIHLWSYVHASWLLNRYHMHAALGMTPYQCLYGRPYVGRICGFGSTVYGLVGTASKYKPRWIKGIWLTKDGADQSVIATDSERLVRTRAIRQIAEDFDVELLQNLEASPEQLLKVATHTRAKIAPSLPPTPLPYLQQRRDDEDDEPNEDKDDKGDEDGGGDDQQGGEREQPGTPDEAASDPPTEDERSKQGRGIGEKRPGEESQSSSSVAGKMIKFDTATQKHTLEEGRQPELKLPRLQNYSKKNPAEAQLEEERVTKANRNSDTLSSSPTFAGNIRQVGNYDGVDMYVDDMEENLDYEEFDFVEKDEVNNEDAENETEGPPEVSKEVLQKLDQEAAVEELERLKQLGVLEDCFQPDEEALELDTTSVYDWRHREGKWKRRCRLVAREFRGNAATDEETFSPTSTLSAMKVLISLCVTMRLWTVVLDVKDAFLQVPQQEYVVVQTPQWVKEMNPNSPRFWRLLKCLPGQRNAALRWYEYFRKVVEEEKFEAYEGMPTVMRHATKRIFLTIHVDDVLAVGAREDVQWFVDKFSKKFSVKSSELVSVETGGEVSYLKKRISFIPRGSQRGGVVVRPNKSYIPKLVDMFKMDTRRTKQVPHNSNMRIFDEELDKNNEKLGKESLFRSGLGLVLYVSQDRPDIQQAVRTLSSYSAQPTMNALNWLKHLVLYLKGTEEYGVWFEENDPGAVAVDRWPVEDEIRNRERSSEVMVEVFSDSNWAGCVSRKSTTSTCVFVGGNLVLSSCKRQMSVALSSCEAELLAASSSVAETMQVTSLVKFCMKDEDRKNNDKVSTTLYVDSSSAKALMLRRGCGRLKHLDIRYLWLQSMVRQQLVFISKVGTKNNPADLNTKPLSHNRRQYLMSLLGMANGVEKVEVPDEYVVRNIYGAKAMKRALLVLVGLQGLQGGQAQGEDGRDGREGGELRGTMSLSMSTWTMLVWFMAVMAMVVTMAWSRRNRVPDEEAGDERDRGERGELLGEGEEEATEVEEDEELGETESEKRRRYTHSQLCEVSEPELWMTIHHRVEETTDEDEPPEAGLPSGSTYLNPAENDNLTTGGFPEERVRCMNDTIHSILTIMAQFLVMPWYQKDTRGWKQTMMLRTLERLRQMLILNRTDTYLARRILRSMRFGLPVEKQPEQVKVLLVQMEEQVGFPDEAFVDLEDAMAWCLANLSRFNNFLDEAQAMFSLMDDDSDGEEPKGGGKGKEKGKKGSKALPFSAFPTTSGKGVHDLHAGEDVHAGEGLHAGEGVHSAEEVHSGEERRPGEEGYGESGRYTEEAVYAEGARLQGEGEREDSVTEGEHDGEEPEPEEEEEESGAEVDPLYRGDKKDDDETKDPDVEDEYDQYMKKRESRGTDSTGRKRKVEDTARPSGERTTDGETCSANYSVENDQVNYEGNPVRIDTPGGFEEPVQQLEEMHLARERAVEAIHERIRQAEIHGEDVGDLEDLLTFVTLL